MRVIWSGFLVAGLFLVGMSVYERRQAFDDGQRPTVEDRRQVQPATAEGGLPFPTPRPYYQH
jgi:hypothetical protein